LSEEAILAEERFLTIEEVAERLRVSDRTVRRWIESGALHAYKPGGEWRIQATDLAAFLETRSSPKAPAPESSAEDSLRRKPSEAVPEFSEGPRAVENWIRFINGWAEDLEEWAYGFHKGADPAELSDREFLAFVGGLSVASKAHRRAQKIVEPLACQYESEDLARGWRRLSRSIQAMVTPGIEQRVATLGDEELPGTVIHLPNRKSA
jgi:excisionase family DNA binding protein